MTIIIDGTNGISGVDGTAANPAIKGNDSNTGISYGTDTVTINTGGVARVTTDASGNVGIGTSAPGASLHVAGAIAGAPTGSGVLLGLEANYGVVHLNGSDGGYIDFSTSGTDFKGRIFYDNSSNAMGFATNGAERMRFNSAGNMAIGGIITSTSKVTIYKDSPIGFSSAHLELQSLTGDVVLSFHAVGGTAVCLDHVRGASGLRCVNLTRTAYAPIEASAFTVPSDYRVKENVTPLTGALDRVAQLSPKRFSYIEGSMSYNNGNIVDGFLAHEAALVVPAAVTGIKDAVNKDGNSVLQGIDLAKLVPLLTAAIQELKSEFDAYKATHP